jgi:hypothetical protein
MADERVVPQRVWEMRQAFDASFADPARAATPAAVDHVMLVRVGTTSYAVRLGECSAMVPLPSITPLPATVPAFCGVSRVKGAAVPVYDLSRLLQVEAAGTTERWLLVAAGDDRVGFIVDGLEGHGALSQQPGEGDGAALVVHVNGTDYRLLQIGRLVAALSEQVGAGIAREN